MQNKQYFLYSFFIYVVVYFIDNEIDFDLLITRVYCLITKKLK